MRRVLKEILDRLDLKTAGTATVVVFVVLFFGLIIGHAGKGTYTRDFLNDYLGVGDTVAQQIALHTGSHVDSGYARTFVFDESHMRSLPQALLFYAAPDQHVYLIARATYRLSSGSVSAAQTVLVRVTLDDTHSFGLLVPTQFPFSRQVATTEIPGSTGIGLNMHTLRITPDAPRVSGQLTIDALVIVANGPLM
ncbi:MAG TPA: hypothetical protein VK669_02220 [Candidatus Limnocylindrales bacterium]|nr:hypothetical protein [Candidatus Limnocylindrales bacterium]